MRLEEEGQLVRDHRKLRAFQLADDLALAVYTVTKKFPSDERFGLTSQMRRAAVSAASNIVEGCAKRTEAEYLRYLETSHGSARELEYQLSLSARLGYVSAADPILPLADETNRVIAGLIRSIRGDT